MTDAGIAPQHLWTGFGLVAPLGARVFGNLMDPASEIRYVLEHKKVFRLKEELGTEPKFWYYTD